MKLDSKDLAFKAGAAIVSGIAASVLAPYAASQLTNTADPKNWYATGGVAVVLGAGMMVLGSKSVPVAAAGAAMIGAGASFAYLGYQGYKLAAASTTTTTTKTAGNLAMGNLAMGNLAMGNLAMGNLAMGNLVGVPATAHRYSRNAMNSRGVG